MIWRVFAGPGDDANLHLREAFGQGSPRSGTLGALVGFAGPLAGLGWVALPGAVRSHLSSSLTGLPIPWQESAMTPDPHAVLRDDARLLETLQRLLAIPAPELRPALTEASNLVRAALEADKVDVFLFERESSSLVAMGTSETELGERQYALGMNRQPLANGGPAAGVFETGEPYLTG